ncbi:MAG: hypothetical protein OZ921_05155 [Sorangiineae bacterium]|nr:hypothetical protein [Polyangiaceae bacterium]MEB2321880.1 hypothetical protein [Sorangiineae bacterium]
MRRELISLALAAGLAGCGSKDAVSLSASIQSPALEVATVALGAKLSGSFDLRLELGARAEHGTEVTPEKFSLTSASGEVLVTTLAATAQEAFPLAVGVGESKRVVFTLDDQALIDAALGVALCRGPVVIRGSVTDTLSGSSSTPVASPPASVAGCP